VRTWAQEERRCELTVWQDLETPDRVHADEELTVVSTVIEWDGADCSQFMLGLDAILRF
jgi:hypothetical protein